MEEITLAKVQSLEEGKRMWRERREREGRMRCDDLAHTHDCQKQNVFFNR